MTEARGGTRTSAARKGVPPSARDRANAAPTVRSWLPWAVAGLAIVWFVVKLWAAYQQIHGNAGDTVAIATAALAVPSVIQATALGGLGGGLALRMATDAWRVRHTGALASRRLAFGVSVAGGVIIGMAAVGAILGTFGNVPSISGVAAAVAIAGLVAGVCAGFGQRSVLAAATACAALASFVLDTILNSGTVLGHMMAALGAGSNAIRDCDQGAALAACTRIVNANSLVSHIDSVLAGLAAGLVAFWYLRRQAGNARWPSYLLAGGGTGLLLLGTEVLTHLGGGGLTHVARAISADDQTAIDLLAGTRFIHGLLVMFIGAFVAMIAFGRSLGPGRAQQRRLPAAAGSPGSTRTAPAKTSRPASNTAKPAADAAESASSTEEGPSDPTERSADAASDPAERAAGRADRTSDTAEAAADKAKRTSGSADPAAGNGRTSDIAEPAERAAGGAERAPARNQRSS